MHLVISASAPVAGANPLQGAAGYEGDAGPKVPVRGLELQGPDLANAAQYHWQHKVVQALTLCKAMQISSRQVHAVMRAVVLNHSWPDRYNCLWYRASRVCTMCTIFPDPCLVGIVEIFLDAAASNGFQMLHFL